MTRFRSTPLRWIGFITVVAGFVTSASNSLASRSSLRTEARVLRVGVDHTPPFYYVELGKPVRGLAVDVLNRAAAGAGYQLVWLPQAKLSVNEAVESGTVDLWPLVAPTPERRTKFYMSDPWLESDYAVVSLESHPVLKPSDAKGLVVSHAKLKIITKVALDFFTESRFITTPDRETALVDICSGAAVAAVLETRVLDSLLLKRPDACSHEAFRISTIPGGNHPLGMMSARAVEGQTRVLAKEIEKLENNGFLSAALDAWCACPLE